MKVNCLILREKGKGPFRGEKRSHLCRCKNKADINMRSQGNKTGKRAVDKRGNSLLSKSSGRRRALQYAQCCHKYHTGAPAGEATRFGQVHTGTMIPRIFPLRFVSIAKASVRGTPVCTKSTYPHRQNFHNGRKNFDGEEVRRCGCGVCVCVCCRLKVSE